MSGPVLALNELAGEPGKGTSEQDREQGLCLGMSKCCGSTEGGWLAAENRRGSTAGV